MSDVTLKDYVDSRLRSEEQQRKLLSDAMEYRLSQMNELREQINNERGIFLNRELFDRLHAQNNDRIMGLEQLKSNLEGRIWAIGGIVTVINITIALLELFKK